MHQSPIEDIIDELEEYIDSCKPKLMSSSQIIVNRDEITSLIEELRAKTPEEIRRYQKIISNRDAILADAQKKADAIIAKAEIQTEELVSEHQIMQQAYAQANEVVNIASRKSQEMIDRATNDANQIRQSAITYTDSLLAHIQEILVRSMDSTRNYADGYLKDMQGYLDVVVANRMELSPEPVRVAASAPQPKVAVTSAKNDDSGAAGQAAGNNNNTTRSAATLAPSATPGNPKPAAGKQEAKEPAKEDSSAVRDMSDQFFNKE
ncbi:MAG: ATPase [Lachnospiraceae bacterium]|nr:ATPase [Lachnospiraceae bacterium]